LPSVLHILNTAQPRGMGIAKIVRTIAARIDCEFRTDVWFVYEDGPLVEWFRDAGIEARFVPWRPSWNNRAGPLRLWATARRWRHDVVHHHSADSRVRWIIRNAMHSPILLHLHGRAVETAVPVPTAMSTRFADRVISVSKAVADFSSTPSEVVYTGVEIRSALPKKCRIDGVVVGCAGRLVALKGFDRLIRAVARVRSIRSDIRLEIAGSGPELHRLEALAAELGVTDAVRFLGWLDDVPQAMRRWDIYVQPSIEEGLGHSLLEAMAEELPVVATSVGGIPEVVVDGETGYLVCREDEDGMARRIVKLAADPQLRQDMGARGRARVSDRFSPDTFAGRVQAIYREMLAVGSGNRRVVPQTSSGHCAAVR
jgi:glycosyltransferase involved in cell wall biosynthesis